MMKYNLNIAKNEILYQSLDYLKIEKMLGWNPRLNIAKTARKILTWYSNFLK